METCVLNMILKTMYHVLSIVPGIVVVLEQTDTVVSPATQT